MKHLLITSLLLSAAALAPVSAQARAYDCSKPGNASKAVCKGGATAPAAMPMAAKPAKPTKPAKPKAPPAVAAAIPASKPAPMAKPAPKPMAAPVVHSVAPPAAPMVHPAPKPRIAAPRPVARPGAPTTAWTTKTGKVIHYDCSKAGNQNKQACKR